MASIKYRKMSPIDHVLNRPNVYVGSTKARESVEFVAEAIESKYGYKIVKKNVSYAPALLRIFVEALSNAIDNKERSESQEIRFSSIKVTIDQETGETSIWNNGYVIPVDIHEEEGIYNHSLIFGHLLTGSNYEDEEDRIISGMNGLGIKLANIFSQKFTVTGLDPVNGKILTQTWTNNMKETNGPIVKSTRLKTGYTQVSWIPDFERFGVKGYTDDIISLYTRYVIDAAMLTGVNVQLNEVPIPVKKICNYADLFENPTDERLSITTDTSQVIVTPCHEYQVLGFVNGVYTKLGGSHVSAWTEALFRPLVEKFNKNCEKNKVPKINISDIIKFFRLIVVSTVIRPEFDGQEKHKLEGPKVIAEIKKSNITTLCKWSVMKNIESIVHGKEMTVLKKIERKRGTKARIEGYDPANNAGTKHSTNCTLVICEGLSAKTLIIAGVNKGMFGKKGRDWFGILPITGKILNVRNATCKSISSNKVITNIIQALNIKTGVDYTDDKNYKSLDYGKIVCAADQDYDGFHIKGLLMNMFHFLFPTVLQRDASFILSMETPIARIIRPKLGDLIFYDENNCKKWISEQKGKIKMRYYKGLGSTKIEDVYDVYAEKIIAYKMDESTEESMVKAFHKKYADDRKEWLAEYDPENSAFSLDKMDKLSDVTFTEFIDNTLIQFSVADCARSIPMIVDGLKECQRKVLYAVKKKKLHYSSSSLKVSQLAGYTSEQTNYHHGEASLYDTVIGMANNYPGKNNISLLYEDGAFGSRLAGSKDSAQPRYIFTRMDALTELIFRPEDEPLLKPVIDDGDKVQPEFYVPIIPMVLVNGSCGIGTGWSSTVPNYNPEDLIDGIKLWLENNGEMTQYDEDSDTTFSLYPDFVPWYREFKGTIESDGPNRYITRGIVERDEYATVTELPINMWTDTFKEQCEKLVDEGVIADMRNNSDAKDVLFELQEYDNGMECTVETLKLHSYVYTSNMVLFDENNKIHKYNSVDEIMDAFCSIRYEWYTKRKNHQINELIERIRFQSNKERFIKEVRNKSITLMNADVAESSLILELEKRGYDKMQVGKDKDDEYGDNSEETDVKKSYEYLLRLQVRNFTIDKVNKLRKDIETSEKELKLLRETTEADMWLKDLSEFEVAYGKWVKDVENRKPIIKKAKK